MKDPFFHCSECGKHIDVLAKAGKHLNRTSPKGEKFVGQCAPFCAYHEIKADDNTALLNCINDNA